MIDICDDKFPQVKVIFGGKHEDREPELIDAEDFIAIKGIKARGKRITTFETKEIVFDEPIVKEEPESEEPLEPEDSSEPIELEIIEPKNETKKEESEKKSSDGNASSGEQMTLGF
jgi:topoisomerase-4 subunit A